MNCLFMNQEFISDNTGKGNDKTRRIVTAIDYRFENLSVN